MIQVSIRNDFESWRAEARRLLRAGIEPHGVIWSTETQHALFESRIGPPNANTNILVPASFLELARAAACYDDPGRWDILYRLLFRLVHRQRDLLEIDSDADVHRVRLMEKAVKRDVHKFHAFVRFRKVEFAGDEVFVAWHEPHHFTVERSAPFFARRFGSMRFSILTPRGCAHWDKEHLTFSPADSRTAAPTRDDAEEFWLLYYRSIFNPFRLKVNAMKKELPVRHWRTLPEAVLIPDLIRKATT